MRKELPQKGRSWADLEPEMETMTSGDIDWRRGRSPMYVFYTTDDVYEVARNAYMKYFTENGLGNAKAFIGVGQMEREVIEMGLSLFNAPENATGSMTTGGTESLLLAIKSCRDWTRANRPEVTNPNVVAPMSTHPAFDKAADLMNLEIRRIPLRDDLRADANAMDAAIDDQTMMIAGAAPCFPHGVIDPIDELSEIAVRRDLWLHVDACVGGYISPFAKRVGYDIPDFDFSLPGVRSMSADLHKFGHCAKPASTVFYRDTSYHDFQKFDHAEWSGGRMITQTYVGTRPGGAIAAAWAVMNHLGIEGYEAIARRMLEMSHQYQDDINAIDGLRVVGKPHITIVAYESTDENVEIAQVAEQMRSRGWLIGMSRQPAAIITMMSLLHERPREEYIDDLKASVADVRAEGGQAASAANTNYS